MFTIPRFFQFDDDVPCHSLRSCDGVGHDLSQFLDNVSLVQPRTLKFGDTNFHIRDGDDDDDSSFSFQLRELFFCETAAMGHIYSCALLEARKCQEGSPG